MIWRTFRAWLAVYPVATLVVWMFGPLVRDWPLPLRTMASTIFIVPLVVMVSTPLVERGSRAVIALILRRKAAK
jgi:antibiotic biosynthesis monooxygenase (ABM) superfamily enzyme